MIDQPNIENQIGDLLKNTDGVPQAQAVEIFKSGLAQIIADAIRSATVTVPPGVPVVTVPASGIGATTAPGVGTLS